MNLMAGLELAKVAALPPGVLQRAEAVAIQLDNIEAEG